mmetsp:Transcript_33279/g.6016  ORF Transcript_33279/g.6016 Transcript_33279/m.6016 type:complete len:93 (-) Transcript_33279:151-429(-)
MQTHIKTEKSFVCEPCDKRFTSKDHLKRHLKSRAHTKIQCEGCGVYYIPQSNSRKKICDKCRAVQFRCELCNAVFKQLKHLNKHKKSILHNP